MKKENDNCSEAPHPISDAPKLDQITSKLYKEFHEKNKELFKRNPQQYHAEAHRYVEERMHEVRYGIKAQ